MKFTLPIDQLASAVLDPDSDSQNVAPELLREMLEAHLAERLVPLGGSSSVIIDDESGMVTVEWIPPDSQDMEQISQHAASLLEADQVEEALCFLMLVLSSDASPCSETWIGLGLALARADEFEAAEVALFKAIEINPKNGRACREYAALLLLRRELQQAKECFQRACRLLPDDAASFYGLAHCLLEMGDIERADKVLSRAMELEPDGEISEAFMRLSNRLAAAAFRRDGGGLRMDAVMYCLSALQLFAKKTPGEVKEIFTEIALLGTQGLQINDPDVTYSLRSMPGKYTGLQLVSYMYVANELIGSGLDVGFDLKDEYAIARKLLAGNADGNGDGDGTGPDGQ